MRVSRKSTPIARYNEQKAGQKCQCWKARTWSLASLTSEWNYTCLSEPASFSGSNYASSNSLAKNSSTYASMACLASS